MKLQPGTVQTLCGCSLFSSLVAQVDKRGGVIKGAIPESSTKLAMRWTGPSCSPKGAGGAYQISSYQADPNNKNFFIVKPAVPPGATVYAQIICSGSPDPLTEADLGRNVTSLDCGNQAAVSQWVLARAQLRGDENSAEFRKAMTHAKMFFQLLNMKYRAELFYELGVAQIPKGAQLLDTANREGTQ